MRVMRIGIAYWKQTSMPMVSRAALRAAKTPGGDGPGSGGSSGAVYFLVGVRSMPEEDRRSSGGASGRRGRDAFFWGDDFGQFQWW